QLSQPRRGRAARRPHRHHRPRPADRLRDARCPAGAVGHRRLARRRLPEDDGGGRIRGAGKWGAPSQPSPAAGGGQGGGFTRRFPSRDGPEGGRSSVASDARPDLMSDTFRPGPGAPGLVFARLRWQMLRNATRIMLGQSLRPMTILLCSLVVWAFVFLVSYLGFRFLQLQGFPLAGSVVSLLFDVLFAALAALLVFSSGLILYSSLFNSSETAFLLSLPVSADQVFAFKFQGAVAFSSWAFVLLGSPILIAFGIAYKAPWYFYGLLPLYFIGFVLIPG